MARTAQQIARGIGMRLKRRARAALGRAPAPPAPVPAPGPSRRVRTVIFFGHHKVGSSALQQFFASNAPMLARAGILYPAVEAEGLALMAARAMGRPAPKPLPMNLREAHNALGFRMMSEATASRVPPYHPGLPHSRQMFRAIAQQRHALSPHTVVLAAEVFANFGGAAPELIERLVTGVGPGPLTLTATLRRPDEYLAAWHGQRLRFGHKLAALSAGGAEGYYGTVHFDYRRMIEPWMRAAPDARLILRPYGAVLAAGGSVEDLAAQCGIDLPEGCVPAARANSSLHRGLVEIARRGNHALEPRAARALQGFLQEATPALDLPGSGEVEMFGAALRAQMVERFAPVHAWLGEIAGPAPFFDDIDDMATPRPHAALDVARGALAPLARLAQGAPETDVADFIRTLDLTSDT